MYITLDRLSQRYGLLPSQTLEHASTLDVMVMDIGFRYDKVLSQKQNGTYVESSKQYSTDELLKIHKKRKK